MAVLWKQYYYKYPIYYMCQGYSVQSGMCLQESVSNGQPRRVGLLVQVSQRWTAMTSRGLCWSSCSSSTSSLKFIKVTTEFSYTPQCLTSNKGSKNGDKEDDNYSNPDVTEYLNKQVWRHDMNPRGLQPVRPGIQPEFQSGGNVNQWIGYSFDSQEDSIMAAV